MEHEAPLGRACEIRGRGRGVGKRAGRAEGIVDRADARVQRPDVRVLLIHDAPDHTCGEERDRHRHKHHRLESHRPADALGEDREDETDRRDEGRDDADPDRVVLDRRDDRPKGEQLLVVVKTDPAVRVAVEEATADSVGQRVDDPNAEKEDRRRQKRGGHGVLAQSSGTRHGRSRPARRLRRDARTVHLLAVRLFGRRL